MFSSCVTFFVVDCMFVLFLLFSDVSKLCDLFMFVVCGVSRASLSEPMGYVFRHPKNGSKKRHATHRTVGQAGSGGRGKVVRGMGEDGGATTAATLVLSRSSVGLLPALFRATWIFQFYFV